MEDTEEEWVRPRGRNASIWEHFKENRNDREQKKELIRVKCNYCPSIFNHSSSTTVLGKDNRVLESSFPQIFDWIALPGRTI